MFILKMGAMYLLWRPWNFRLDNYIPNPILKAKPLTLNPIIIGDVLIL